MINGYMEDWHELEWMIKRARDAKGLDRRGLAKALDVRAPWLERLELGEVRLVRPELLARITKELELDPVAVDWLSGGRLEGAHSGLRVWSEDTRELLLRALEREQRLIRELLMSSSTLTHFAEPMPPAK